MTLVKCPSVILSHVMLFLNNKTNTHLINTCKELHKHGKKIGYLTSIKTSVALSMMIFINNFCDHSRTLKTVEMRGIDDPHLWLPNYTQHLIFDHCSISEYLNPGRQARVTKSLKLRNYHRYKNKQTLRVNWECFPNLEELELYVYDVDMTGIEKLKKLKTVVIDKLIGSFVSY